MTMRSTLRMLALGAALGVASPLGVLAQDQPAPPDSPAQPEPAKDAPPASDAKPDSDATPDTKPESKPARKLDPRDDPYSAQNYIRPDKPGLQVGNTAPDIDIIDYDGTEIPLKSMYENRPLVVVFVKGAWCSVCRKTMLAWKSDLDRLTESGASLIMICPQKQEHINQTIDAYKLEYPIFCDRTGRIARAFRVMNIIDHATSVKFLNHYKVDLSELSAYGTWDVPAHATFVIDTHGIVRFAEAHWPAALAVNPENVLKAVRELRREKDAAPPAGDSTHADEKSHDAKPTPDADHPADPDAR